MLIGDQRTAERDPCGQRGPRRFGSDTTPPPRRRRPAAGGRPAHRAQQLAPGGQMGRRVRARRPGRSRGVHDARISIWVASGAVGQRHRSSARTLRETVPLGSPVRQRRAPPAHRSATTSTPRAAAGPPPSPAPARPGSASPARNVPCQASCPAGSCSSTSRPSASSSPSTVDRGLQRVRVRGQPLRRPDRVRLRSPGAPARPAARRPPAGTSETVPSVVLVRLTVSLSRSHARKTRARPRPPRAGGHPGVAGRPFGPCEDSSREC